MKEIPGIESIIDGVDSWGQTIPMCFEDAKAGMAAVKSWNLRGLAMIPHCMRCKVPVVWMIGFDVELYRCPICGRVWIKGEGF